MGHKYKRDNTPAENPGTAPCPCCQISQTVRDVNRPPRCPACAQHRCLNKDGSRSGGGH